MTFFSYEQKLKCVERELAMRRSAYPGWVERGKMTREQAEHELAVMQEIAEDYRAFARRQTELFA